MISKLSSLRNGMAIEDLIALCLNDHYGFDLTKASPEDDRRKKIDYYLKTPTKNKKVQIKSRRSGPDILFCRWQPYYGIDHEHNAPGRDYTSPFDLYVCLGLNNYIRIVMGQALRDHIHIIDKEWKRSGFKLPFKSCRFPGDEYKLHRDCYSGVPKILTFLKEENFITNKDIGYYPYISK